MPAKVNYIPQGYHTTTPYLIVKDAAGAVEFYKKAFGAVATFLMAGPGGKIAHAEMRIEDSMIMIGEHQGVDAPAARALPRLSIYLYVKGVDGLTARAIAAGAKEYQPVQDQFYGDRQGGVTDPFGIVWWIATHVEDVSPEEMQRRAQAAHRG
ncbi:MAG: VOC family protein [Terriglobales bacterium]